MALIEVMEAVGVSSDKLDAASRILLDAIGPADGQLGYQWQGSAPMHQLADILREAGVSARETIKIQHQLRHRVGPSSLSCTPALPVPASILIGWITVG
jgi:hypothetical protein